MLLFARGRFQKTSFRKCLADISLMLYWFCLPRIVYKSDFHKCFADLRRHFCEMLCWFLIAGYFLKTSFRICRDDFS